MNVLAAGLTMGIMSVDRDHRLQLKNGHGEQRLRFQPTSIRSIYWLTQSLAVALHCDSVCACVHMCVQAVAPRECM